MVEELYKNNWLIYIMLGLGGVGILLKMIISSIYRRLMKAAKHMGTTNHKVLKALRTKFETNYTMNLGVNNVDIFVDKYVYTQKFCGIYLYTWENLSGQILLLSMLIGSISAIAGLLYECGKDKILLTLLTGIVVSAVLISLEHFINIPIKKFVIRANIKDYLENYLITKLEYNKARALGKQGEGLVNAVNEKKAMDANKNIMSQKELAKLCEIDKDENKIIQDILDEYII